MTEARRRAGLISELITVLSSLNCTWQLTSEGRTIHLVVYDGTPNKVFTFREDTDIIRATSALKGGE